MTDDKPDESGKTPTPPEKAKPASQKRPAQTRAAQTEPATEPDSRKSDAAVVDGLHATTGSEDAVAEADQAVADSVTKATENTAVGTAMQTISDAVSGEARQM